MKFKFYGEQYNTKNAETWTDDVNIIFEKDSKEHTDFMMFCSDMNLFEYLLKISSKDNITKTYSDGESSIEYCTDIIKWMVAEKVKISIISKFLESSLEHGWNTNVIYETGNHSILTTATYTDMEERGDFEVTTIFIKTIKSLIQIVYEYESCTTGIPIEVCGLAKYTRIDFT